MRRGGLFRSAMLPLDVGTSASDLFGVVGIRRIIDLRTAMEVEEDGIPILPGECARLHIPLFDSILPHWPNPVDRTPRTTAGRYFEMVHVGLPRLVTILQHLSDTPAVPTLFHCLAGRDRTGIVVALLLDLLDVPDESIGADYALSDVMNDDEGRNANPKNILLFLELIREQHGSVDAMLSRAGMPPQTPNRLRTGFLV